jgi:hypothetical protein
MVVNPLLLMNLYLLPLDYWAYPLVDAYLGDLDTRRP